MMNPINSATSSSETIYHYPPILQDTPLGSYFTGPIKNNQPYTLVNPSDSGKHPELVKDIFDPNLFWAKNPEGELVQTGDGTIIYVPPRPAFPAGDTFDSTLADNTSDSDGADTPYAQIPFHFVNPCPGGLPNNPYEHRNAPEHELQNTINQWIHQLSHKPTVEDYKRDLEQNLVPLFQHLTPSTETIVTARDAILNRGKRSEIQDLLKTTSLNTTPLSDQQLHQLSAMREAVDKIFSMINDLDLWGEYPCLSEINKVLDVEVTKDHKFFKKLIEELSTFASSLPYHLDNPIFRSQEIDVRKGWNSIENRDQHLQALADVLFDGNLIIREQTDWERRFSALQSNLTKITYEVNRHTPKSLSDVKLSSESMFLGILNGIVEESNSSIKKPLYDFIKSNITGELYPFPLSEEQASTWGYHNAKLATELVFDAVTFSLAGKLFKAVKPAVHYAWKNRTALAAAIKAPQTTGKAFLTEAGLISPQTGKVLTTSELQTTFKTSKFCLHDAGLALQKKGPKGYFHCIKEFNRRQSVRQFCIEKGFNVAKTNEIMAIDTLEMEVHHILSPKSIKKGWTLRFNRVIEKYGLDLEGSWNKIRIPHKGRHVDAYHQLVLDEIRSIHSIAKGDEVIFLDLFEQRIKNVIEQNPLIVRGIGL